MRRSNQSGSIIVPILYLSSRAPSSFSSFLSHASSYLIPVTRAQVHADTLPHAVHNVVNAPWLPLIARREVGLDPGLVEWNALLHRLHVFGVVLVGVHLWVVVPDPARVLGLRQTRVELDLGPVGFLQELGVGETELLGAGVAEEAVRWNISNRLGGALVARLMLTGSGCVPVRPPGPSPCCRPSAGTRQK